MDNEGIMSSRRGFVKTAGAGILAAAAAAGAFGMTGCSAAERTSGAIASQGGGVAHFGTDMYTDVFPVPTRSSPVIDVPTAIDSQGEVA